MKILKIALILIFGFILIISIGLGLSKLNNLTDSVSIKESDVPSLNVDAEKYEGGFVSVIKGGERSDPDKVPSWLLLLGIVVIVLVAIKYFLPTLKSNTFYKIIIRRGSNNE